MQTPPLGTTLDTQVTSPEGSDTQHDREMWFDKIYVIYSDGYCNEL